MLLMLYGSQNPVSVPLSKERVTLFAQITLSQSPYSSPLSIFEIRKKNYYDFKSSILTSKSNINIAKTEGS